MKLSEALNEARTPYWMPSPAKRRATKIANTSAGAMKITYDNAIRDILDNARVQNIPVQDAYDLWTKNTTLGPKAKKEILRIVKKVGK